AEVDAANTKAAAALLHERNLFPITITDKSVSKASSFDIIDAFKNRIPAKERVLFSRQLATLINSGLPVSQSLASLVDQSQNKALKAVVADVQQTVEGGSTLAKALERHPHVFSPVYTYLVAAGESSGTLDAALNRLANQQEKDQKIVSKIRGAMIYPAIVLAVIIGVLALMLVAVVPEVAGVYKSLGKPTPFVTQVLLALSNFTKHFWWLVLILLAAAAFVIRNFFRTEAGRALRDRAVFEIPIVKQLVSKLYMARFARTQETLVASGVPVIEALGISRNTINNSLVEADVDKAIEKVKAGIALSVPLSESKYFPVLVPQLLKVGEQTGNVEQMLGKLADHFEDEVDEMVNNLSTLIEPVLMIVLGVLVGGMIAAVLGPIYGLIGAVQ
ncbi:MAG: type II secretion system F family protein, partial [bacterium]